MKISKKMVQSKELSSSLQRNLEKVSTFLEVL